MHFSKNIGELQLTLPIPPEKEQQPVTIYLS